MKFIKAIRHNLKVLQLRLQGAVVVDSSWEATYMELGSKEVVAIPTSNWDGHPCYMDAEIVQNLNGEDECVLHYVPTI